MGFVPRPTERQECPTRRLHDVRNLDAEVGGVAAGLVLPKDVDALGGGGCVTEWGWERQGAGVRFAFEVEPV